MCGRETGLNELCSFLVQTSPTNHDVVEDSQINAITSVHGQDTKQSFKIARIPSKNIK